MEVSFFFIPLSQFQLVNFNLYRLLAPKIAGAIQLIRSSLA